MGMWPARTPRPGTQSENPGVIYLLTPPECDTNFAFNHSSSFAVSTGDWVHTAARGSSGPGRLRAGTLGGRSPRLQTAPSFINQRVLQGDFFSTGAREARRGGAEGAGAASSPRPPPASCACFLADRPRPRVNFPVGASPSPHWNPSLHS